MRVPRRRIARDHPRLKVALGLMARDGAVETGTLSRTPLA
jgi:hypothetical protein